MLGQACGRVLSGALRDHAGSYVRTLESFAALAGLSAVSALWARQPRYSAEA